RTGMALMGKGNIKDPGAIRNQFTQVTDIVPTMLEAANLPAPETIYGFKQVTIDGKSLRYTFNNPDAKETHTTQYFDIIGTQGI
ncbi:arylsulfatase, partial [Pseudoalteromonas spongiae]